MIQPSRARVEVWRQRLRRSLRDALDPQPARPPKGEAAKRDYLARERDRLTALEELRAYCRGRMASGNADLRGLADIAENIGFVLLLSPSPAHALQATKRLFGMDRRLGAPVEPQSVEIARDVARAVSGGARLAKAIGATADETGAEIKQVERHYRNHRRAAIEANAAEAMEKMEPVQSDLSGPAIDAAIVARLREKERKPRGRKPKR